MPPNICFGFSGMQGCSLVVEYLLGLAEAVLAPQHPKL